MKHIALAERLATVMLCASCPNRMFLLPKYAIDPDSVRQYALAWKNRGILAALYGENTRTAVSVDEVLPLLVESIRRKKKAPGEGEGLNVWP
jgi:serine protease inhibitor